jgi:hypothetical protein
MTQPFRSHTPVMDPLLGSAQRSSAAVKRPDSEANYLMDEIFGEVEQVLDGSLIPPDEPMTLAQPRPAIQFDVAAALADRYPQLAMKLDAPEADEIPELPAPATALSKPEAKVAVVTKPQTALSLFERLMIFTGCASAIAALAVWLVAQGMVPKGVAALSQKLQETAAASNQASLPVANEVDVKFSEYMLRSLAAIDRNAATQPKPAPVAVLPAPITSPSTNPLTSGSKLPQPAPLSLPSSAVSPVPVTMPAPVSVQPSADMVTRREMNQVMNRIVGMLERIAPGVSNRLQLPNAVTPKAQTIAKAPATRAAAKVGPTASTPTAPVANLPQRTLTGVVEMGDRSAVLFELNGVTQRIYLGETIGSTGWSLVEVAKDAAILRRNGEVRTVGVGQKL